MIPLKDDKQRLWDLVRYTRYALSDAGLITDQEFAELESDRDSSARLSVYCYRMLEERAGQRPA